MKVAIQNVCVRIVTLWENAHSHIALIMFKFELLVVLKKIKILMCVYFNDYFQLFNESTNQIMVFIMQNNLYKVPYGCIQQVYRYIFILYGQKKMNIVYVFWQHWEILFSCEFICLCIVTLCCFQAICMSFLLVIKHVYAFGESECYKWVYVWVCVCLIAESCDGLWFGQETKNCALGVEYH